MANPQKENGFTPIANEILESVYSRKFTANQLFILLVLWRYTYGFQRKDHDLSLGFISEATGIDRKAVKRAMDNLLENNVVVVTKEATFSESRRLAFNKNYESWNIEKRTKEPQGTKKDPVGKNDHTTGGEFDHTTGGKNDHQERNIKEILNKVVVDEDPSGDLERKIIQRYMQLAVKPGFDIPEEEKAAVRQVIYANIPQDKILALLDQCFADYQPKHARDKINSFKYCATYILNKYYQEKEGANNNVFPIHRRSTGYAKQESKPKQEPIFGDYVGRLPRRTKQPL